MRRSCVQDLGKVAKASEICVEKQGVGVRFVPSLGHHFYDETQRPHILDVGALSFGASRTCQTGGQTAHIFACFVHGQDTTKTHLGMTGFGHGVTMGDHVSLVEKFGRSARVAHFFWGRP